MSRRTPMAFTTFSKVLQNMPSFFFAALQSDEKEIRLQFFVLNRT